MRGSLILVVVSLLVMAAMDALEPTPTPPASTWTPGPRPSKTIDQSLLSTVSSPLRSPLPTPRAMASPLGPVPVSAPAALAYPWLLAAGGLIALMAIVVAIARRKAGRPRGR